MKKPLLLSMLLLASFMVVLGQKPTSKQQSEEIKDLQRQIKSLEYRLDQIRDGWALISTEGEEYDVADTKFGPFVVSTEGITPYLDGYKIQLSITNTASVAFRGADITVMWGIKTRTYQTKKFTALERFDPGQSTKIDIVITPARPDDVKEIMVKLKLNRLITR